MRGVLAFAVLAMTLASGAFGAAAQEQRPSLRYAGCRAADGVDRRLHEI